MLVTQVLGNVQDIAQDVPTDVVAIEWFDTRKRIARYVSSCGRDVAIHFEKPLLVGLNHGDILAQDGDVMIVISIIPTRILTMQVHTNVEIARLCYEIGNYHLPLFFGDTAFVFRTPFEKTLQRVLDKLRIKYQEELGILDSKDRLQVSMVVAEPKLKIAQDFQVMIHNKAGNT